MISTSPNNSSSRYSVDCRKSKEDHQSACLDDLLLGQPECYAMLSAYIDESFTHTDSPMMCVGGLMYESKGHLKRLDSEWKKALKKYGIKYFHAVDAAHFKGEFEDKGKTKDERTRFRDAVHKELISIIRKHVCAAATVYTISEEKFNMICEGGWEYDRYTTCTHFCMLLLQKIADRLGHREVSFFIEAGHENAPDLKRMLNVLDRCWNFVKKKQNRPIQTADIWAYETGSRVYKKLKDPSRRLRKSLKNLFPEDQHTKDHMRVYSLNEQELQKLIKRRFEMMVS